LTQLTNYDSARKIECVEKGYRKGIL